MRAHWKEVERKRNAQFDRTSPSHVDEVEGGEIWSNDIVRQLRERRG